MWFAGWQSPWPLRWGGAPTLAESLYEALLANVGYGHPADQDGKEWRWREAKALGFSIGAAAIEQAFYQYEPSSSGAGLAYWRELYRIDEGFSDQEARDLASFLLHDSGGLDVPTVLARLRSIDPRFQARLVDPDLTTVTMPGCRAFEPWDGGSPFNLWGRQFTRFANHSTAFQLVVTLNLQHDGVIDPIGPVEKAAMASARAYLDEGVAWCCYSLTVAAGMRARSAGNTYRCGLGNTRLVA